MTQNASQKMDTSSTQLGTSDAGRPRGQKAADAFRTISEVAEELNVPQHVLRFWETRFFQVRPVKRGGGRRYYRPEDVALIKKIHHLLYTEGYTIKGVQKLLKGVSKTELLREQGMATPGPLVSAQDVITAPANEDSRETGPESGIVARVASQAGLSEGQRRALESALSELQEIKTLLTAA